MWNISSGISNIVKFLGVRITLIKRAQLLNLWTNGYNRKNIENNENLLQKLWKAKIFMLKPRGGGGGVWKLQRAQNWAWSAVIPWAGGVIDSCLAIYNANPNPHPNPNR
jgi:hypothetical protein